jgi:beta-glucosidase
MTLYFCAVAALAVATLAALSPQQEAFIQSLVSNMTVDEKVGQMTQAEIGTGGPWALRLYPENVTKHFLGSVLNGGGAWPGQGSLQEWCDSYDEYQTAALATRLKIPIIYGQDAVHGVNNLRGATIFPHNIGLGAANNTELTKQMGEAVATELLATGTTWNFAPCLAVARDDRWGRTYESFGEVPSLAASLGTAFLEGLQESGLVAGSIKHFAGDGGTAFGTGSSQGGSILDRGDVRCTEAVFRSLHLAPYLPALEAGAATVMVSYSSFNGLKMSQNKYLITDVLKGELQFDGMVVSDWDAILELNGTLYTQVVESVNAGIDLFMMPWDWPSFITTLKQAITDGAVSTARVNDAVTRILRVKVQNGLFDHPKSNRSSWNSVGSVNHRQLASALVSKSLVLLQHKNSVLPLHKNAKILVAGTHADNMGYQCGGWTKSWQGEGGNITAGTTFLAGIRQAVAGGGGSVTFNEQGTGSSLSTYDVAVLFVGELPYAEYMGDTRVLNVSGTPNLVQLVTSIAYGGLPVVLVVVSGRPVVLPQQVIDLSDAIIAAWLPGSEGGDGLARVLFGDENFSGKLPVSWPRSVSQEPINYGDANYNPLFPLGFGLTVSPSSTNSSSSSSFTAASLSSSSSSSATTLSSSYPSSHSSKGSGAMLQLPLAFVFLALLLASAWN